MKSNSKQSEQSSRETLIKASETTDDILNHVVNYVEVEFNTGRIEAIYVVGILISLLPSIVRENKKLSNEIQEMINDFKRIYDN